MNGLSGHAEDFIRMPGGIVRNGSFPEEELEHEQQVILQEFDEDADDGGSAGFKLFDQLCFGQHAFARPVIGTRRNIERIARDDLVANVQRQYTGSNIIVAVAILALPQAARARFALP